MASWHPRPSPPDVDHRAPLGFAFLFERVGTDLDQPQHGHEAQPPDWRPGVQQVADASGTAQKAKRS